MPAPEMAIDSSWKGVKHDLRGGRTRNEQRVLIAVDVIPQNGCNIGDQHIPQGKHQVLVYGSELAAVRSLVRTDKARADLARAMETWQHQFDDHMKGADDEREKKRRAETFGVSPYEILAFDPSYRGGLGPLESLTVVEDVPAPPTLENLQASQFDRLGEKIAQAIGFAASRGPTSDAAIEAEVERRIAARTKTK